MDGAYVLCWGVKTEIIILRKNTCRGCSITCPLLKLTILLLILTKNYSTVLWNTTKRKKTLRLDNSYISNWKDDSWPAVRTALRANNHFPPWVSHQMIQSKKMFYLDPLRLAKILKGTFFYRFHESILVHAIDSLCSATSSDLDMPWHASRAARLVAKTSISAH